MGVLLDVLLDHGGGLIDGGVALAGLFTAWKLGLKRKIETLFTVPFKNLQTQVTALGSSLGERITSLETASTNKANQLAQMDKTLSGVDTHINNVEGKVDDLGKRLAIDKDLPIESLLKLMRSDIQMHECILRCHMDVAGKMAYQTDNRGNTIWVSKAFCKNVGVDLSDCVGRNWVNIIHPATRRITVAEWDAAIAEERDYEGAIRFKSNRDGVPAYEGVSRAHALRDDDGRIMGYFGYFL